MFICCLRSSSSSPENAMLRWLSNIIRVENTEERGSSCTIKVYIHSASVLGSMFTRNTTWQILLFLQRWSPIFHRSCSNPSAMTFLVTTSVYTLCAPKPPSSMECKSSLRYSISRYSRSAAKDLKWPEMTSIPSTTTADLSVCPTSRC